LHRVLPPGEDTHSPGSRGGVHEFNDILATGAAISNPTEGKSMND
jgi:hypothetical protein